MKVGKTAPDRPWDAEQQVLLERWWAEGLSLSAIGARMGRSKNGISGRVHRTGLPPRPSPITGVVGARKAVVRRIGGRMKDTLTALLDSPLGRSGAVDDKVGGRPVLVAPVPPEARFPLPVVGPTRSCCWPLGEPRTKGFRFCEAVSAAGRSYCPEHCALAYVVRKERSSEEAAGYAVEAMQAGVARANAAGPLAGMA